MMKQQIHIDHNPRASNNVVPYHIGQRIGNKISWKSKTYGSLDAAIDACYQIFGRDIQISHN